MPSEARTWTTLAIFGVWAGVAEVALVLHFQRLHGITDESMLGGPVLALGTVVFFLAAAATVLRRRITSLLLASFSVLLFFMAYVLLVQW